MDAAMIQSCQGSWDVKVGKSGNGQLYFKEGWLKFVNHHSLRVGEFLVFEHKGNMVFNVVSYGLSACEKEYHFPSDSMVNGRMTTPHETQRVKRPRDDNLEGTHFFRTIMKPSHRDKRNPYMNIPPSFVEANGIAHKSSMTLIDPSRHHWKVDLKHWKEKKRQRVTMARGWTEFYRANKLNDRDVCIFELHQKTAVSKNVVVNVKICCH
ncbi:PREDICTED: B3 domain-containing protein Os03g0212300-like [Fragaria vesca subsp. vesca]|nr:PREDICTED: B3 domain-containing protein Os03g0212300-like [Fragaria vesca subsp. vesca]